MQCEMHTLKCFRDCVTLMWPRRGRRHGCGGVDRRRVTMLSESKKRTLFRILVKAKFHYTDPTGPNGVSPQKKSGRVRVVEFSSSPTMCADFVRVGSV